MPRFELESCMFGPFLVKFVNIEVMCSVAEGWRGQNCEFFIGNSILSLESCWRSQMRIRERFSRGSRREG